MIPLRTAAAGWYLDLGAGARARQLFVNGSYSFTALSRSSDPPSTYTFPLTAAAVPNARGTGMGANVSNCGPAMPIVPEREYPGGGVAVALSIVYPGGREGETLFPAVDCTVPSAKRMDPLAPPKTSSPLTI